MQFKALQNMAKYVTINKYFGSLSRNFEVKEYKYAI